MMKMNMKSISMVGLVLALVLGLSSEADAAEVKVILLGGQSNMLGRAPVSGLPLALQEVQSDVLFFGGSDGTVGTTLTTLQPDGKNAGEFGPEVTFGRTIADASPATQYTLIKYAAGGTALYNDWAPGTGNEYAAFRNTVTAGLAALQAAGHTTEIIGMLWHQGENDAIETRQASYASNLTAFIADMRSNYGTDLPFFIGEIRRSNGPAFVTVADAQISVAAADPNAWFVPASDLSFRDTYHFDAPSMITLGERFASSFLDRDSPAPAPNLVSIADDKPGASVAVGTTVTYTVTFSKDMDETTVGVDDFGNAGTASVSFGTISETASGVFLLSVVPTSAGSLRLQVNQNAVLLAATGEALVTAAAILDNTVITVVPESVPQPITGVTIASQSPIFNASRNAVNLINGNGFTEATGHHSSTGGDNISWTGASTTNHPLGHTVVFDLGENYNLSSIKLWNWNTSQTLSAGSKDIDLFVTSTDGGSFTHVGSHVLTIGPGQNNVDFGQVIELSAYGAAKDVRQVKLVVNSNHGWTNASVPGLAGLSEIRFRGNVIPTNTYDSWIANFGLAPDQLGFEIDADGDGLANGLEAWFGSHPGQFSPGIEILSAVGTTVVFSHPEQDAPPEDLSLSYQWSPDLINWFANGSGPDGGAVLTLTPETTAGIATVSAVANEVLPKIFFRLRVDLEIP